MNTQGAVKLKSSTLFLLSMVLMTLGVYAQSQEFTGSQIKALPDSPQAMVNTKESAAAKPLTRIAPGESEAVAEKKEPSMTAQVSLQRIETKRIDNGSERRKSEVDVTESKDQSPNQERFHWKSALNHSGLFLGIQHSARLFQVKTTREFGGPFFRDWGNSIKNLRGWNDGDSPFTNNFAHPLQGGVTGRIFINNSDRARKTEFGKSKQYWNSRLKALVWSAAWSTQFELGPISEATIGNVGLRRKNGHSTMAWTDLVMTPLVGTAVVVEEDMIDKYILKNWLERKNNNRLTTRIKILRSVLTPTTSFSNLLRGKYPWNRDDR